MALCAKLWRWITGSTSATAVEKSTNRRTHRTRVVRLIDTSLFDVPHVREQGERVDAVQGNQRQVTVVTPERLEPSNRPSSTLRMKQECNEKNTASLSSSPVTKPQALGRSPRKYVKAKAIKIISNGNHTSPASNTPLKSTNGAEEGRITQPRRSTRRLKPRILHPGVVLEPIKKRRQPTEKLTSPQSTKKGRRKPSRLVDTTYRDTKSPVELRTPSPYLARPPKRLPVNHPNASYKVSARESLSPEFSPKSHKSRKRRNSVPGSQKPSKKVKTSSIFTKSNTTDKHDGRSTSTRATEKQKKPRDRNQKVNVDSGPVRQVHSFSGRAQANARPEQVWWVEVPAVKPSATLSSLNRRINRQLQLEGRNDSIVTSIEGSGIYIKAENYSPHLNRKTVDLPDYASPSPSSIHHSMLQYQVSNSAKKRKLMEELQPSRSPKNPRPVYRVAADFFEEKDDSPQQQIQSMRGKSRSPKHSSHIPSFSGGMRIRDTSRERRFVRSRSVSPEPDLGRQAKLCRARR